MTTLASYGKTPTLRREHVRLLDEEKEFDEVIDYGAARREKSLAMDTLETLGPTAPRLVATASSSSPKCIQSPRGPTAQRERSLPLDARQSIDIDHADVSRLHYDSGDDFHLSDATLPEANAGLQRKTQSYSLSVFGITYTSGSGQSSDSGCCSKLDAPSRRASTLATNCNRDTSMLARVSTMRRNILCNSGTSSLLRKTSKLTPRGQELVRKAGVFDCPCDARIALKDLRTILERNFRCEFLPEQHHLELRARVRFDTTKQSRKNLLSPPKRKTHCSIVVEATDVQGFCRLCIRLVAADTLLVDGETFDTLCTRMFYKLSEIRQVTRPYFI